MNDVLLIEQKIAELMKKKQMLQQKEAENLYKKISTLLGEQYTPELVLGIITTAWKNKDHRSMEEWKKAGNTFRGRSIEKPLPTKNKTNNIPAAA